MPVDMVALLCIYVLITETRVNKILDESIILHIFASDEFKATTSKTILQV